MNPAGKIKQWLRFIFPEVVWRGLSQFKRSLNKKYDAWCCCATVKYIYGPKEIKYAKSEVVVICLVRNGSAYIQSFIEHYFSLGAQHIVFLDNDSEDDTISLARKYQNVTVLSSNISFNRTMHWMHRDIFLKQYLINRFGKNRWCLNVDIDEFFDYPFSNIMSLGTLLDYLNAHSYTAVVSQLLDMFSDRPLNESGKKENAFIRSDYRYYDISSILKRDYFAMGEAVEGNILSNKNIQLYKGGIRKKIFGTSNWLVKHPLFFSKEVRITGSHCVSHARCADFTAVCFHYKFVNNYYEVASKYLRNAYGATSEYAAIASECKKTPNLILKRETAKELNSVNDLIENEFLVVSENYLKFIDECKQGG